ncbi:hypothetical protein IC575_019971 [Cucumis melo]
MVEDVEGGFISPEKLPSDYPMKIVWKKVFIRLFLVGGILWMLLILTASLLHVWSCRSSITFFSGISICNKESKVFTILDSMGIMAKAQVHCGFMRNGGAEMVPADIKYVKKCRFVVASGIFDGYDVPRQPSNIYKRSF